MEGPENLSAVAVVAQGAVGRPYPWAFDVAVGTVGGPIEFVWSVLPGSLELQNQHHVVVV